jgi:ubiquinone/menaquinone biosynthesis C-methylase UbiE
MAEAAGQGEHREEALAGLSGRVIEVGAGNGMNFGHYPATVTEVVAVEPEPYLRDRAREAAQRAPVAVRVVEGVADELPAADGEFDAGVASLVLCSVADQERSLAELRRVIRPGGELRFYEHVVARRPAGAGFQRFSDATYWPLIAGGCHCSRDTEAAIRSAGFEIERARRTMFSPSPFTLPAAPHVIGVARRA